jgi:hypothetical protein
VILSLSGCGDGVATFDQPEFGVVFSYPSDMSLRTDVRTGTQAGDIALTDTSVALALDRYDLITISRHTLRTGVTGANLNKAKAEFDRLISQLAPSAAPGSVVQHGGLPGLEYRFQVSGQPGEASRHTILFDGDTEYTLDCQSTPDQRADLERACDTALSTLHRR